MPLRQLFSAPDTVCPVIDIHCHLLPQIDDGAQTLDESFQLLQAAASAHVTELILTPHYISHSAYHADNSTKARLLEQLQQYVTTQHLPLKLHLGNEIFLDDNILELINTQQISPLANSRYLLIELPMQTESTSAPIILSELIAHGYIPVIAHPERYPYIQAHPDKLAPFLQMGCLLQGDYLALLGKYGQHAQHTLRLLIKQQQIFCLASDVHHYRPAHTRRQLFKRPNSAPSSSSHPYHLATAQHLVTQLTKDSTATANLFYHHPHRIITNS